MSFNIKNLVRAVIASAILTVTSFASAAPVPTEFVINELSFQLQQNGFNGPNRLDASFISAGAPAAFSLTPLSAAKVFNFGRVTLTEDCINGPKSGCSSGNGNETENLGVTALFSFASPVNDVIKNVAVTGAFVGTVADDAVDFFINFDTVKVAFGNGGLFQIDLSDASFSKVGQFADLTATVTLLQAELPPAAGTVPEPGSLALLGLAFAGVAFARRRK